MSAMKTVRARRIAVAASAAVTLGAAFVTANPVGAAPTPSASVANDTLTVTGTNAAELLALRLQAGQPGQLQVDFGDDGGADFTFDRSTFSKIEVFLGGGNDQFRVDQANGLFTDEAITVDGGPGDDVMTGGEGAEVFMGGPGDDNVDGKRGNDTAYLGAGADVFRWDPGDGSDVVEGDAGTDTLDFNGSNANETMALSGQGTRSLFTRDVASIRMDMHGVERLDVTSLGGTDTVTIGDMSGTDFRRADLDLSASTGGGDGQADTVVVDGSAAADRVRVDTDAAAVTVKGLQTQVAVAGSETMDLLKVATLDGNDAVTVDGTVFALITPTVDLGPGQA